MSRDLGIAPGAPAPPPATRVARPGWRDPRLWIGVLLVTGSIVLGARVLAAADDTITVWALGEERGRGTPVDTDDLVAVRIRFADDATSRRYFPADDDIPEGLVLTRAVGSGELLARSAVGPDDEGVVFHVPLEVAPQRVPPDVGTGSVIDVWVADAAGPVADGRTEGEQGVAAAPALSEVTVVAAPAYDDTFAVTGERQIVIRVDEAGAAGFERLLASFQDPVIRILQRS